MQWKNISMKMLMILYFVVLARGNEAIESACASLVIPHFYVNGHCFTYHTNSAPISVAESTCTQGFPSINLTGGRLAVLPNITIINAFLQEVGATNVYVWVGAFQEEPTTVVDANWYWKENPVQTSTKKIAAITASAEQPPWYGREPNDAGGQDERCAFVRFGYGLFDMPCSTFARFACEFDSPSRVPPCNLTNPCENNGTCVDDMTALTSNCTCTPQWYGENCTEPVPPCNLTNPCENNGTCVDDMTTLTSSCTCTAQWYGVNCTEPVPPCNLGNPCENDGTCVDDMTALTSSCSCSPQWYGEYCTEPKRVGFVEGLANDLAEECVNEHDGKQIGSSCYYDTDIANTKTAEQCGQDIIEDNEPGRVVQPAHLYTEEIKDHVTEHVGFDKTKQYWTGLRNKVGNQADSFWAQTIDETAAMDPGLKQGARPPISGMADAVTSECSTLKATAEGSWHIDRSQDCTSSHKCLAQKKVPGERYTHHASSKYKPSSPILGSVTQSGVRECAFECLEQPGCLSFNLNPGAAVCELLSVKASTDADNGEVLKNVEGWHYYERIG